jgi:hypothetical protein
MVAWTWTATTRRLGWTMGLMEPTAAADEHGGSLWAAGGVDRREVLLLQIDNEWKIWDSVKHRRRSWGQEESFPGAVPMEFFCFLFLVISKSKLVRTGPLWTVKHTNHPINSIFFFIDKYNFARPMARRSAKRYWISKTRQSNKRKEKLKRTLNRILALAYSFDTMKEKINT